jgi:hypothetical protein
MDRKVFTDQYTAIKKTRRRERREPPFGERRDEIASGVRLDEKARPGEETNWA